MTFAEFFKVATGHKAGPYDYQCKLAGSDTGRKCESLLIAVPTGLGKTAAVVIAWLWNRIHLERPDWPRRLVYCLPMRTLVEQTRDKVKMWLNNLASAYPAEKDMAWLAQHSPIILMGGMEKDLTKGNWDLYPEKPAIVIGTQDMLLSRALNRGYGISRYRWPMHFALLNNDCLWVLDETQLMGVGLETSAQLEVFRRQLGVVGNNCCTWWMSATLEEDRLVTVDHTPPAGEQARIKLTQADLQSAQVQARVRTSKPLEKASVSLTPDTKKRYAKDLANFIVAVHKRDSLTLVVVNRVDRAQDVYQALKALNLGEPIGLVHSRFRPQDRQKQEAILYSTGGRIVIATQALEAGVDVSARTLITELAPWPALVQRFGRCNRRGEFQPTEARVYWIDISVKDAQDDLALPYTVEELKAARQVVSRLSDVGLTFLSTINPPHDIPLKVRPVLRRKDIVELFDTTPDLAGYDLDVSRFIRDGDDTDVHVYWRDLQGRPPAVGEPDPLPEELCPVALGRFSQFLSTATKKRDRSGAFAVQAWSWNALAETWQVVSTPRAGGVYLLDSAASGYSAELGWTGVQAEAVPPVGKPEHPAQYYADDQSCFTRVWVTLADHTEHVIHHIAELTAMLAADLARAFPDIRPGAVFEAAARWHDVGKAFDQFQAMLRGEDTARTTQLWAKSAAVNGRCARRFFRHELASALAWLQLGQHDTLSAREIDLVAYMVAAHHGKVRLSLRSLPGEEPPTNRSGAHIARGVIDGDTLPPEAFKAVGVSPPSEPLRLSLELMELGQSPTGQPSWLARMLALRDHFGPFRLAWLETMLRVADARASVAEQSNDQAQHRNP